MNMYDNQDPRYYYQQHQKQYIPSSPESVRSSISSSSGSGSYRSSSISSVSPTSPSSSTYPTATTSYYYSTTAQRQQQQQPPEYICLFPNCVHSSSRKADLERHVKFTHNRDSVPLVDCAFVGCRRVGKAGFTRKDKMVEHMREFHKVEIPKRNVGGRTTMG